MSIDELIKISGALLTPIIAAVATYIAWQQWRTNRHKLNLDRYDRRLRVYEEVRRVLSLIMRDCNIEADDLLRFRTSVSEADFLFGQDVIEYIDQIYERGLRLRSLLIDIHEARQEELSHSERELMKSRKKEELEWLTNQLQPAKKLFKKYLDISA